ncbi:unnamed protein product [Parajaminaea phylloscopi]
MKSLATLALLTFFVGTAAAGRCGGHDKSDCSDAAEGYANLPIQSRGEFKYILCDAPTRLFKEACGANLVGDWAANICLKISGIDCIEELHL